MIPPVIRKPAVVVARRGIGSEGWSAYRKLITQIHVTFEASLEHVVKCRNEARQAWFARRTASGEDLKRCVEEAAAAVEELKLVVPVTENEAGEANVRVTSDHLEKNSVLEYHSPKDLQDKLNEANEQVCAVEMCTVDRVVL